MKGRRAFFFAGATLSRSNKVVSFIQMSTVASGTLRRPYTDEDRAIMWPRIPGPVDVLYADEHIIVVNKQSGVLSVPGLVEKDSIATRVAVLYDLPRIDKLVVHRLDQATSGIIVFARSQLACSSLNEQFRKRKVRKRYNAIVYGRICANEGEIDLPLRKDMDTPPLHLVDPAQGKPSLTTYTVLQHIPAEGGFCEEKLAKESEERQKRINNEIEQITALMDRTGFGVTRTEAQEEETKSSNIEGDTPITVAPSDPSVRQTATLPQNHAHTTRILLVPHTGRSHQLRIHLKSIGHPILGDDLYAFPEARAMSSRCLLHAQSLSFTHPATKEPMYFDVPPDF